MSTRTVCRVAFLAAIVLTSSSQAVTQTGTQMKFEGIVDDYTPTLDPAGPWHVSGKWSLALEGNSGRGDFSIGLNMVRSDNPTRSAHTHHVILSDAVVTPIANGFSIIGGAVMTSNGNVAGFSGSSVDIRVTGGSGLPYSNVTLLFGGAAVAHFGDQLLHGVVTLRE